MRRLASAFLAATLAATSLSTPAAAQGQAPAPAPGLPPHAFLFGTWTGGIFPAPANPTRESCLATPVVIFTRDLAMRAVLTQAQMVQREVETVRVVPTGFELRFVGTPGGRVMGPQGPVLSGFGCDSSDVLHVQRRGENEISFPGCADFPNPLVRCR